MNWGRRSLARLQRERERCSTSERADYDALHGQCISGSMWRVLFASAHTHAANRVYVSLKWLFFGPFVNHPCACLCAKQCKREKDAINDDDLWKTKTHCKSTTFLAFFRQLMIMVESVSEKKMLSRLWAIISLFHVYEVCRKATETCPLRGRFHRCQTKWLLALFWTNANPVRRYQGTFFLILMLDRQASNDFSSFTEAGQLLFNRFTVKSTFIATAMVMVLLQMQLQQNHFNKFVVATIYCIRFFTPLFSFFKIKKRIWLAPNETEWRRAVLNDTRNVCVPFPQRWWRWYN